MDVYTTAAYRPSPLRAAQVVAALVGTFWQGSLHAQTPARLDTISVVASRVGKADAGRSVDVITRDAITASSARTVSELLAARLGIDVSPRSPAQADLSIRGSSPEQVAVLVDGVRVSDVQSAHYALDLAVPLEAIERVEVLRGAASALYGPDAVGGVINIVTRRGGVATRVATRAGAFQTLGGALATSLTVGATTVTPTIEYDRSNGA
ncbi:MAG: TonB-dependent receptor plug domain-containing protein, partial [Gemmatimonadetes bacterium]|nr:TonB-dependent receptor plug domain-containing protein [Gemmatimonadota bacterium]